MSVDDATPEKLQQRTDRLHRRVKVFNTGKFEEKNGTTKYVPGPITHTASQEFVEAIYDEIHAGYGFTPMLGPVSPSPPVLPSSISWRPTSSAASASPSVSRKTPPARTVQVARTVQDSSGILEPTVGHRSSITLAGMNLEKSQIGSKS
jgi:hypothetical protein